MRLTIHRGTHEIGGTCIELATAAKKERSTEAERRQLRHLHAGDERRRPVDGGTHEENEAEGRSGAKREPKLACETAPRDCDQTRDAERGQQDVARNDGRRCSADADVERGLIARADEAEREREQEQAEAR